MANKTFISKKEFNEYCDYLDDDDDKVIHTYEKFIEDASEQSMESKIKTILRKGIHSPKVRSNSTFFRKD